MNNQWKFIHVKVGSLLKKILYDHYKIIFS